MMALQVVRRLSEKELGKAARSERDARARSRILAIRYVLLGRSVPEAAEALALGERRVRVWVHRYNEEGLEGLRDRAGRGRRALLAEDRLEEFKERVRHGPLPQQELSAFRGRDIQCLLKEQFGAEYSLSGTYFLLHRLGFSSLVPRPQHPGSDPEAQEQFKRNWRK